MPTHDLAAWRHSHAFDSGNRAAERGTMLVMWITLIMMVIEISSGWWLNSMALLADAATSVLGIVGAILISIWARTLVVQTGKALLDREMDAPVVAEIRKAVETGPDEGNTRIADLHVWRVGKRAYACALSLVTHDAGLTPARVHEQLAAHDGIMHATVEIHVRPASS
jgi:Co/Zn/Cd efflux system component